MFAEYHMELNSYRFGLDIRYASKLFLKMVKLGECTTLGGREFQMKHTRTAKKFRRQFTLDTTHDLRIRSMGTALESTKSASGYTGETTTFASNSNVPQGCPVSLTPSSNDSQATSLEYP
ncbi:hypothetical protein T265_05334 [Opisthorchis viverrini]|uniref:Uncharacterized protein n=1 Tax=Opisthorchis viverrini TaxID=6198 RepID=A0A074ZPI6_OPIVI|nr:hypothetical protein T265_05334 [Opisthorchis viverrini]KER27707.1 hypothetical protein T265_05334 [Opisthorchis viverrini]